MNQSFRISDKALRISLIVGSILLVTTVLILSIAVGTSRHPEATTTGSYLTVTDSPRPATTTPPSTEAGTKPDPTPEKAVFKLTRPVDGYLTAVHDTETLSFSITMQDYRTHTGIDIETEDGAAVVAAAAGTVTAAYEDPMMGYCIEIDHGDGYVTVYRNLTDTVPDGIEVGTTVRAGQLIGAVGSSALIEQAELPHLHFELTRNDEQIDPLTYLAYEERAEE
ncbi:MAG: M23 family metallopeptidase [Clostridia bacterium]|nr:M23 family metallopeptidase [Clostridia bacterium]